MCMMVVMIVTGCVGVIVYVNSWYNYSGEIIVLDFKVKILDV
jgi:hypothetical protein